jgi:periplasmic mercuric ion binding protein
MKAYFLVWIALFCCASSFITPLKTSNLVVHTRIYCDHCGVCETCKPGIVLALENVSGVKSADLDIEKQEISVWYNDKKTDPQAIRMAIVNYGYAADDMEPNQEAYDKLDGCCKKESAGESHDH